VIKVDDKDISFNTIEVLDEEVILVPYAENLIHFRITSKIKKG